jgi:hypothetical protein
VPEKGAATNAVCAAPKSARRIAHRTGAGTRVAPDGKALPHPRGASSLYESSD